MAKSILNVVMQGASGKIGKMLVFRQTRNGETVIAIRGKKRSTPLSAKEEAVRERFREAAHTAKILAKDPVYGAVYRAKAKEQGKTAYILAMKDCLTSPNTKSTKLHAHNGEIVEASVVPVIEDLKAAPIKLRMLKANNTVIEHGLAAVENKKPRWGSCNHSRKCRPSGIQSNALKLSLQGLQHTRHCLWLKEYTLIDYCYLEIDLLRASQPLLLNDETHPILIGLGIQRIGNVQRHPRQQNPKNTNNQLIPTNAAVQNIALLHYKTQDYGYANNFQTAKNHFPSPIKLGLAAQQQHERIYRFPDQAAISYTHSFPG